MPVVVLFLVLLGVVVGAGVGGLIGAPKGLGTQGRWLGGLFGVAGWIVVGLMEPTLDAAAEREIAVASRVAQLGGRQVVVDRAGGSADRSPERRAEAFRIVQPLRDAAAEDQESARMLAAVDALERTICPQHPVSAWTFASGACALVARIGTVNYLISADGSWSVLTNPVVTYDESPAGDIVRVQMHHLALEQPRPPAATRALLHALRATPAGTSTPTGG